MAAQIETSWKYEYADNVRLALQQSTSKLEPFATVEAPMGEGYRPETQVGEATYQARTTRLEAKTAKELDIVGRWVEPFDYDIGPFYDDKIDRIRNGISMDGQYTKAAVAAAMRAKDDVLLDAFFDDNKVGKNGSSTVSFDTTNMRVASGSAGLTVDKMIQMKEKLIFQEVDLDAEKPNIAVTEKQYRNLMTDILVTSGEFNDGKVLPKGVIEEYVGFNIIVFSSKRLTKLASGERRCPVWVKSGLLLANYDSLSTSIRVAEEMRGNPYEVYGMFTLGATRLDEKKCGEILCAE